MNQTRTFLIFAWMMVAVLLWMEWGKDSNPAPAPVESAQQQVPPSAGALPGMAPGSDAGIPAAKDAGIPSARPVGSTGARSEEHTSELQSLMRISYAVFCLKKKNNTYTIC